MTEYTAMVIRVLAEVIENLASGHTKVESVNSYTDFHADFITFQPLGTAPQLRKRGPGTVTTELKLRLVHREKT